MTRIHPPAVSRYCLWLLLATAVAPVLTWAATTSDFTFESSPTFENAVMPYRMYKAQGYSLPANANRKYPLIIWLHGLGERGTNNTAQMTNGVLNLVSDTNQNYDPAFLIAPQINTDCGGWASELDATMVKAENRLFLILDYLKANYRIDPDRIYIMGLSQGGGGTWNLATRHLETFAAIAPMSQGGSGAFPQLSLLANFPIWAFDGSSDAAAGATLSVVNAIRAAGGRVNRTLYSGTGHNAATWGAASGDPDFYKWLMAQRRNQLPTGNPSVQIQSPGTSRSAATVASTIDLAGIANRTTATSSAWNSVAWSIVNATGTNPVTLASGNATGTSSWSINAINYLSSPNLIQTLATSQNNASTTTAGVCVFNDSIMVNDSTAPTLTVLQPVGSGTYVSPTDLLTIRGSAADNATVTQIRWTNDRGGSGLASAEIDNRIDGQVNWFITNIPLQSGHNLITITASDLTGNSVSKTVDAVRPSSHRADFFRQDFESSSNISSYVSTSLNPPANSFYDIAADTGGGTWSITNGALQIARTGAATSNEAAFFRRLDMEGPPQGVLLTSFDISIPGGSPNISYTNYAGFTVGFYLGKTSALGGPYAENNTDLQIVGAGTNKFLFKVNSTSSTATFNSDGTVYSVKWYINSSGSTQSYVGPDNTTQTLNTDCSAVWVGTTRILNNAAKSTNYKSKCLRTFRFGMTSSQALTLRLDNLAFSDFPVPTPLETWRSSQFSATDAQNAAVSGDFADPDGDGLCNLMEYALSGNPGNASAAVAPSVSIPSDRLEMNLTRLASADVTYIVEASSDLVTWTPIASLPSNASAWTGSATVTESGTGATRSVNIQDAIPVGSDTKRFLRLRVTNP